MKEGKGGRMNKTKEKLSKIKLKYPEIREILQKLYTSAYRSGQAIKDKGDSYDHSTAYEEIEKSLDSMRKETEKKRFEEVSKGLEEWARRAKKHKWLKFGDDDWYDEEEVLSSLLGFTGYFKYFNNLKTKNE